jgi:hypothetical protein
MGHIGNFGTLFFIAQNISLYAVYYNIKTCQDKKKKIDYLTYKAENPFRISTAP